MAKPDDRSDNVEKLQRALSNTMENMRETKDYLKAHEGALDSSEQADLEAKNQRRETAIQGFREEIKDEAEHQGRS